MSRSKADAITVTGKSFVAVCADDTGKVIMPYISYLDSRSAIAYDMLIREIKNPGYAITKLTSDLMWIHTVMGAKISRIKMVMDVKEYFGISANRQITYDIFELTERKLELASSKLGLGMEFFGKPHGYDESVGRAENGAPVYMMPYDTRTGLIGSGIINSCKSMVDIAGTTEILGFKVKGWSKFKTVEPVIFNLPVYFSSPHMVH
ncbi:MAG: hypothetical protein QW837_06995 [Conexivisphaerales archaeon]